VASPAHLLSWRTSPQFFLLFFRAPLLTSSCHVAPLMFLSSQLFRATRQFGFVGMAFWQPGVICSLSRPPQDRATVSFHWRSLSQPRINSVCRGSFWAVRCCRFVIAAFRSHATVGFCWRGLRRPCIALARRCSLHRAARQFGFADMAFQGHASICSSSWSFLAVRRCHFVVMVFWGHVTVWSFVGMAFRGRASILFVVGPFGPRDSWDLLARPLRLCVDFVCHHGSFRPCNAVVFVVMAFWAA